MKEFICTFGFGHVHPSTGQSLANHYIVINAKDIYEAHSIMFERFGVKWAFIYTSKEEAGVDEWDLIELKE